MPHFVKLDFLNVFGNFRLWRVKTGFTNPAVNQRAVAVKHFAEHRVGCFGERIKDDAEGFGADDFVVGTLVANNKMPPARFAFVALFAACETALVKIDRMTVLAIHGLDNFRKKVRIIHITDIITIDIALSTLPQI